MNEWKGYSQSRHWNRSSEDAVCEICSDFSISGEWWCGPNEPCPCCLSAKVERLTERMRVLELERETLFVPKLRDARKRIEEALAFCEQQIKDRSLYSDDRKKWELAYIDGWNDALEIVENALGATDDES